MKINSMSTLRRQISYLFPNLQGQEINIRRCQFVRSNRGSEEGKNMKNSSITCGQGSRLEEEPEMAHADNFVSRWLDTGSVF